MMGQISHDFLRSATCHGASQPMHLLKIALRLANAMQITSQKIWQIKKARASQSQGNPDPQQECASRPSVAPFPIIDHVFATFLKTHYIFKLLALHDPCQISVMYKFSFIYLIS